MTGGSEQGGELTPDIPIGMPSVANSICSFEQYAPRVEGAEAGIEDE